jgi:outer membrane protein OmpA-like peptidoglycan-associated protein
MKIAYSKVGWTVSLLCVSVAALADEPAAKPASPQEPVGFVTGALIGGFAAGPVGVVVGAGLGTWLGNRVHRAKEAAKEAAEAKAEVAALRADELALESEKAALLAKTGDLSESNRDLKERLDQLSHSVVVAENVGDDSARDEAAKVLDGLQGDVLFRTGSAELTPEMVTGIKVLADAVAKSPALKVRVDGYADPRGTVESNLKLSEARADAVRDVFLSAGVSDTALEINAYGKSQSIAADSDGYALERRVRLTLQAQPGTALQARGNE